MSNKSKLEDIGPIEAGNAVEQSIVKKEQSGMKEIENMAIGLFKPDIDPLICGLSSDKSAYNAKSEERDANTKNSLYIRKLDEMENNVKCMRDRYLKNLEDVNYLNQRRDEVRENLTSILSEEKSLIEENIQILQSYSAVLKVIEGTKNDEDMDDRRQIFEQVNGKFILLWSQIKRLIEVDLGHLQAIYT